MEMAKIGPGVAQAEITARQLTDEDSAGPRAVSKAGAKRQGCSMGLDQMGNMFARREGSGP